MWPRGASRCSCGRARRRRGAGKVPRGNLRWRWSLRGGSAGAPYPCAPLDGRTRDRGARFAGDEMLEVKVPKPHGFSPRAPQVRIARGPPHWVRRSNLCKHGAKSSRRRPGEAGGGRRGRASKVDGAPGAWYDTRSDRGDDAPTLRRRASAAVAVRSSGRAPRGPVAGAAGALVRHGLEALLLRSGRRARARGRSLHDEPPVRGARRLRFPDPAPRVRLPRRDAAEGRAWALAAPGAPRDRVPPDHLGPRPGPSRTSAPDLSLASAPITARGVIRRGTHPRGATPRLLEGGSWCDIHPSPRGAALWPPP